MSTNPNNTRTPQQREVIGKLEEQFDLDSEKIRFLNKDDRLEPWFPAEVLTSIARQSGKFKSITEGFAEYIPGLNHIIHSATVVDLEDRPYTRSGASAVGEILENGESPDEHGLAAARALNAALTSAGFNPIKAASVVIDLKLPPKQHLEADQAASRVNDLKMIHLLAAQKGLIKLREDDPETNDLKPYREWLVTNFGENTAAKLGPADRAAAINMLREMPEQLAAVA